MQHKGRLFGYVAKTTTEKNISIISLTMHMLMWFKTRVWPSSRDATWRSHTHERKWE